MITEIESETEINTESEIEAEAETEIEAGTEVETQQLSSADEVDLEIEQALEASDADADADVELEAEVDCEEQTVAIKDEEEQALQTTANEDDNEGEQVSTMAKTGIDDKQAVQVVEAALFAAGEALSVERLQQLFALQEQPERQQIKSWLEELQIFYQDRGVELVRVASGYRFQAKQAVAPWLQRLWQKKPPRFSRALLETLALIVYRQPITRGEIEEIRGVAVSTHIIKTLTDRGWVRVIGRRDVPGKPALLGSTKQFLDDFSLNKLSELPPLEELKDLEEVATQLELDLSVVNDDAKDTTQSAAELEEDANSDTEVTVLTDTSNEIVELVSADGDISEDGDELQGELAEEEVTESIDVVTEDVELSSADDADFSGDDDEFEEDELAEDEAIEFTDESAGDVEFSSADDSDSSEGDDEFEEDELAEEEAMEFTDESADDVELSSADDADSSEGDDEFEEDELAEEETMEFTDDSAEDDNFSEGDRFEEEDDDEFEEDSVEESAELKAASAEIAQLLSAAGDLLENDNLGDDFEDDADDDDIAYNDASADMVRSFLASADETFGSGGQRDQYSITEPDLESDSESVEYHFETVTLEDAYAEQERDTEYDEDRRFMLSDEL